MQPGAVSAELRVRARFSPGAAAARGRQVRPGWQALEAGEMTGAYYNEHDPGAAAWLRELIKLGLIDE